MGFHWCFFTMNFCGKKTRVGSSSPPNPHMPRLLVTSWSVRFEKLQERPAGEEARTALRAALNSSSATKCSFAWHPERFWLAISEGQWFPAIGTCHHHSASQEILQGQGLLRTSIVSIFWWRTMNITHTFCCRILMRMDFSPTIPQGLGLSTFDRWHLRLVPSILDDGWPESVEEQGLLLLVWRHQIRNNILKMCYRQLRRGVLRQKSRSARQ